MKGCVGNSEQEDKLPISLIQDALESQQGARMPLFRGCVFRTDLQQQSHITLSTCDCHISATTIRRHPHEIRRIRWELTFHTMVHSGIKPTRMGVCICPGQNNWVVENFGVLRPVQDLSRLPLLMPVCGEDVANTLRIHVSRKKTSGWSVHHDVGWYMFQSRPTLFVINGSLNAQEYVVKILELVVIPHPGNSWNPFLSARQHLILIQCTSQEILWMKKKSVWPPGQQGHWIFQPLSTFGINWQLPSPVVISHQGTIENWFRLLWRSGMTSLNRESRLWTNQWGRGA